MVNKLINENSPYLLQHAENPVDWYPWGNEALDRAKDENKPIFLSVGYAACHWCHVMEHESFENEKTAKLMNENFVNIKVDREERPDIDDIYMQAVVALTGQGGWPMSVFLTPDGKPFFGGTYFPPEKRYNMPSFSEVLLTIANLWEGDNKKLINSGEQISAHIKNSVRQVYKDEDMDPDLLDKASVNLIDNYDRINGGWGQAPKFPQPMVIEYLLRRGLRGQEVELDVALHALRSMARGGLYDVLGGGFARYSVDNVWLVPHFEKMLYDNAQLATVYLHAYLMTGEKEFKQVCEETLDFVVRELAHPEGGFFSSLDADSEGEEGKYYTWSMDEIKEVIQDQEELRVLQELYGISEEGNFEAKNIFQRNIEMIDLAERFETTETKMKKRVIGLHSRLFQVREKRVRPGTDDKIIVFWNALMMMSFAEAGRYLKRSDYTQVAIDNANFIRRELYKKGRLMRVWREGKAKYNAYLEDYAAMVLGSVSLYQSSHDIEWYKFALVLAGEMIDHFSDGKWGFFDTRDDHETLLIRPKKLQDNAVPTGNAMAVLALLQLAKYGDRSEYVNTAEEMLGMMGQMMIKHPTAFGFWLTAADFAMDPTEEVAVLFGDKGEEGFLDLLWGKYRPFTVVAVSPAPVPEGSPGLLANKGLINRLVTGYVCKDMYCNQPVNDSKEFSKQLIG